MKKTSLSQSFIFILIFLAVDGSVKLKQRGKDVMFEGDGKIVRLDVIRGCFGFIDSADVGSVFFNISAVRPSTTDVTKVLKLGQKVKFRALPNLEQPNCKWRASIVCAAGKASEFLHAPVRSLSMSTSTSIGTPATSNGISSNQSSQIVSSSSSVNHNNNHVVHRSGSADTRLKSSSFCSSSYASSENIAVASSPEFNSSFNDNFDMQHHHHQPIVVGEYSSSSSNYIINSSAQDCSTPTTTLDSSSVTNGVTSTNGYDPLIVLNTNGSSGGGGSCNSKSAAAPTNSLYDTSMSTASTLKLSSTLNNQQQHCSFGVVGESLNGGLGGMKGYQQKNQNNLLSSLSSSSSWPITTSAAAGGVDPAAMWDLYLEQQQKALTQNFNPFVEILPSSTVMTATTSSTSNFLNDFNKSSSSTSCTSSMHLHNNIGDTENILLNGVDHKNLNSSTSVNGGVVEENSICRNMKKLAHELNGWRSDECAFCRSEDSF